ncbi:MAG: D-alanyl-D-alanine carboxypeptidase, partial [Casimicrobium sp.]
SLPIAATDGTLTRRFTNPAIQGNAFLKTGTLTGVKALAGYLQLPNNRRFVFVAMMNHANADGAVEALDSAVEWVFASVR